MTSNLAVYFWFYGGLNRKEMPDGFEHVSNATEETFLFGRYLQSDHFFSCYSTSARGAGNELTIHRLRHEWLLQMTLYIIGKVEI